MMAVKLRMKGVESYKAALSAAGAVACGPVLLRASGDLSGCATGLLCTHAFLISPTHKRTEGRAPVWGSEFTSKDAALQGGVQQKPL